MITGLEPRVLHVSEADAVRNMASILQSVQAGMEVVIERDAEPLRPSSAPPLLCAERSPSASRWLRRTRTNLARHPRWTRTLPPTWKRSSAIANRGIRLLGTNPRFQCGHRRRA